MWQTESSGLPHLLVYIIIKQSQSGLHKLSYPPDIGAVGKGYFVNSEGFRKAAQLICNTHYQALSVFRRDRRHGEHMSYNDVLLKRVEVIVLNGIMERHFGVNIAVLHVGYVFFVPIVKVIVMEQRSGYKASGIV